MTFQMVCNKERKAKCKKERIGIKIDMYKLKLFLNQTAFNLIELPIL